MPNSIFQSLRHFFESWWLSDRIRASPSEGRLLRIRPGAILVINGVQAEVVSRRMTDVFSIAGQKVSIIGSTSQRDTADYPQYNNDLNGPDFSTRDIPDLQKCCMYSFVCLCCDTPTGHAELQIGFAVDGKTSSIVWKHAGECHLLESDDIEVWRNENPGSRRDLSNNSSWLL